MPAVQLARLKTQLSELSWQFTHPVEFSRALNDLLEFYAEHVYRAGHSLQADRLRPAYHVPVLVMRQIQQELIVRCQENPGAALTTADALWKDSHLEPRLIAIFLLGQAPLKPPDEVISRLKAWCQPQEDNQILSAVLSAGSLRLRREMPGQWFALVKDWVTNPYLSYQSMGLKALIATIEPKEYDNFPPIYDLLLLMLPNPSANHQNELLEIIETLAKRNPRETVFYLREILSMSSGAALARLVRRALPFFDEAGQESLKNAMKKEI
jgi:hypothetical protein